MGTANLLNAAREVWKGNYEGKRFYHVSTDEVYGSLGAEGFFLETTPYDPQSPYSASKAASDHLVRAYGNTYDLPFVITNCSNNYGPNHFPEKLTPEFLLVDLAGNLKRLAEDQQQVLTNVLSKAKSMNKSVLQQTLDRYGNGKAKKLLTPILL